MSPRFVEVTDDVGRGVVHAPGHRDDGKLLRETRTFFGMRIWQAVFGGYSWSIVHESGLPKWGDEDKTRWRGYTASYRRLDQHTSDETIHVDGEPFATREAAERACFAAWQALK